jgi:hypothetical protein
MTKQQKAHPGMCEIRVALSYYRLRRKPIFPPIQYMMNSQKVIIETTKQKAPEARRANPEE